MTPDVTWCCGRPPEPALLRYDVAVGVTKVAPCMASSRTIGAVIPIYCTPVLVVQPCVRLSNSKKIDK